jgi:hypothetical protein
MPCDCSKRTQAVRFDLGKDDDIKPALDFMKKSQKTVMVYRDGVHRMTIGCPPGMRKVGNCPCCNQEVYCDNCYEPENPL